MSLVEARPQSFAAYEQWTSVAAYMKFRLQSLVVQQTLTWSTVSTRKDLSPMLKR